MLLSGWGLGHNAEIIISIAVILLAGFLMTRLTKKIKLPDVTAYITAGIVIGPYALNLIPQEIITGLDFVTDVALAFIAFGTGQYFRLDALRGRAGKVVVITLCESLLAAAAVTLTMLALGFSLSFSLLLGAIGCATAPASTMMTIRQYKARGEFVDTVLQVVALDDAVSLIAFSICAAVCGAMEGGAFSFELVGRPVLYNIIGVALGALGGWALKWLVPERRSRDNRLILAIAVILALTGICSGMGVSPLLACMAMGTAYANTGGNAELFRQVYHFTPPIMTLFFVLSGLRLEVPALRAAGLAGIAYFAVRVLGKFAGAALGARVVGEPPRTQRFLGLTLVPQAGVSIGLAALGQRLLPDTIGTLLNVIILSSAVLYEMIGPACAKLGLQLAGAFERPDEVKKAE